MQRRLQEPGRVGLARLAPKWGDCHAYGIGYCALVGTRKARRRVSGATGDTAVAVAPASAGYIAIIALLALMLAAEVARLTLASGWAEEDPNLAERLAPHSADTAAALAMAGVGRAAVNGADPDAATMRRLQSLSALGPLRTEPYLVQGALAERAGDLARAEALLRKARSLDPRSLPARYLLSDVWLRQGKVLPALSEMARLVRLTPAISVQLIPALAEYAQTPGARQQLGTILATNPKLRTPLLAVLASNPDNADLMVALAGPDARSDAKEAMQWKSRLLRGLAERGDYHKAHRIWNIFMGKPPASSELLANGDFRKVSSPAPFGWTYSSGGAGLAEPQDGTLRVLYYGRDNATLASQLLLLGPGTYTFVAPTNGTLQPATLHWRLTCTGARDPLFELDLTARPPGARFTVPSDCQAQRLELLGTGSESPQDADVQIGPAKIEKARS
jgi:tetratricopeptide (TPR) repeat protein